MWLDIYGRKNGLTVKTKHISVDTGVLDVDGWKYPIGNNQPGKTMVGPTLECVGLTVTGPSPGEGCFLEL